MLAAMIKAWEVWLLVVGLAIGAATTAVILVRLPRGEDDVAASERRTEAAWIAETIERYGGIAPTSLVEEVLDLHQAYLEVQRPPRPPSWLPAEAPGAATVYATSPGYQAPPGYAPHAGYPPTPSQPAPPGYPPPPGYPATPGSAAAPRPDDPQATTPPPRRR